MKLNHYRKEWSAWLPLALEALAKEPPDYAAVMPRMPLPPHVDVPLARIDRPLKLALLSTSGAYDARSQAAFAASAIVGDATHRVLDLQTPDEAIKFSHEHYDRRAALADRESVLPRRTLRSIGVDVARNIISWSGFLLDWPTFIEATIPQIVARVHADGANAALVVPI
jgi:hypothetical protein